MLQCSISKQLWRHSNPNLPKWHRELAVALSTRYDILHTPLDLLNAVEHEKLALQHTPEGSGDRPEFFYTRHRERWNIFQQQ
ncbi:hypothetical protein C8R44DRAFT_807219 [Mycena epipterygia]|nr:hypothetical protein C8R44DRAFT_807219 [Mycena epipterygia]